MRNKILFVLLSSIFVLGIINVGYSQSEDLYDTGTVWTLSFIRTGANTVDDYIKGIKNTWEAVMKESVKEGLIKSYKILLGTAANQEDFNIVLMIENKNMATFDPDPVRDAKMKEIEKKIKENMKDEYDKTVSNYEKIRQWLGAKSMREIYLK
jgi:hypothetical protein